MSVTSIEQALEASERLLSQAHEFIRDQILETFLDRIPGVDVIANELDHLLEQSVNAIAAADQAIKTQVQPLIEQGIPNAISSLVGIAETVEQDVSTLLGEIATVDDVTQTIFTEIRKQGPALAQWIYHNVVGQFGNVTLGVLKEMEGQEADGINALLDHLLSLKGAPPYLTKLLEGFRNRGAEWQALALPAVLVGAIVGVLEATQEPLSTVVRQDAFNVFPTKVTPVESLIDAFNKGIIEHSRFEMDMLSNGYDLDPQAIMRQSQQFRLDPRDLANLHFRKLIDQGKTLAEMRLRGLSPEYANWMLSLASPLLSEDAIRNSYLRGMISGAAHDGLLEMYGYTEAQAQQLRALYFYIPPVQDLIHMGIRNVFSPELVERFTLSGDYPKAFEDAARQQGVSAEWALKYWQAHWIMPGREAFFEMFQRTVDSPIDPHADTITLSDGSEVHNIIGRDTLNLALRDIDTPPFYRDKLTEVAYRPLTRIDIRRLAAMGLLTHAQVERAYLDNGYNQKNARRLADFVDTLNAKVRKDEAAQLVDSLRKEVIRLFVAGKLQEDEIKGTLHDLLFTDAETNVFLREAELVREAQLATALETGIGKLYVNGIITDKDAIKRMQAAKVPVDAQSLLFQKWDLEIEYKGGTEHIHKHRELTVAEVEQALADQLITPDDAKQHFLDMGFDDASATGKVSLTLYKAARAVKAAQIEAIRASYVNGTIEALEASNRLDALFIPSGQRDANITTWTLQRETRTERIPLATLRDMAQGDYITQEELLTHLKRHRFTDADAALIVRYWMAQKPPKSLVPA